MRKDPVIDIFFRSAMWRKRSPNLGGQKQINLVHVLKPLKISGSRMVDLNQRERKNSTAVEIVPRADYQPG